MKKNIILLLTLILSLTLYADGGEKEFDLKHGATNKGKRQDEAMQKFRDNRLGKFIHWGLYAIPAGEWDGKKMDFTETTRDKYREALT